jgi:predicted nucleotidyltransferase
MNILIEENRREFESVCRLHHVERIELFGSATGPNFDPDTSDLDFLVTFKKDVPLDKYADAYFGLLRELEDLFERRVDLVVDSAIDNPYFRQAVDSTRTLVYAA